jgi:long-chain fatty acid transport protein
MQRSLTPRLIPVLVALAFSGSAAASGFQLIEQNASGLGNAYAGSAAIADNASTIFFNPAGMTQLQAREFSAGLDMVNTSYKLTDQGSSVSALAGTGNGGDGGGTGWVPNGYLSWALSKDLYLGIGVSAPFGLATEYDSRWIGAAQSQKFEIKTINVNPSIAYRVNDTVSLGFGLNWQNLDAEYKRLTGITAGTSLVTATLKLEDDAWGWNAGVLFKLSPTTKVGVSYRSTIKYEATGTSSLVSDGSALGNGTLAALNAAGASSNVKATIEMPDTFIMSAAQVLNDRWEMLGDLSWTGWSSIPQVKIMRTSGVANNTVAQTLDTDFRNTWRVAFGANYKYNDAWKLKFGIAYDQTPVKNETKRLVSLPDNDRTWLSVGAEWKPNTQARVDLGLAYLFIRDAKINNDQTTTVLAPTPPRGIVTGTYKDSAWILGAQYSQSF